MNLKEITKESAISEFKRLCAEDFTKNQRRESIGTNTCRTRWELDLQEIVVTISIEDNNVFLLHVFSASGSIFNSTRTRNLMSRFIISNEEYIDLKKHYFGEFTVDEYYMEKISNTTAKYKSIKDKELELNEDNIK